MLLAGLCILFYFLKIFIYLFIWLRQVGSLVVACKLFPPHTTNLFIYLFIYLFMAALGLHCCMRAFSSCGERGLLFCCGAGASHCHGFSCGAQPLGARASVVVAHGLSSCGSRAVERRLSSCGARAELLRSLWDLPRPGLEPMSPAGRWILNHWHANSFSGHACGI